MCSLSELSTDNSSGTRPGTFPVVATYPVTTVPAAVTAVVLPVADGTAGLGDAETVSSPAPSPQASSDNHHQELTTDDPVLNHDAGIEEDQNKACAILLEIANGQEFLLESSHEEDSGHSALLDQVPAAATFTIVMPKSCGCDDSHLRLSSSFVP